MLRAIRVYAVPPPGFEIGRAVRLREAGRGNPERTPGPPPGYSGTGYLTSMFFWGAAGAYARYRLDTAGTEATARHLLQR